METPRLDQNQFLKQVRERAQVVSKSARQKPGDVAERFGQQQEEGDQEMQDYLAIIRGTDSNPEVQIKINISDDLELDFASCQASDVKLDFSKERMKANLAHRRVQKRRRPQSWAWVAESSGSAVQIDHNQGVFGNEINLSVKLDEDEVEEKIEAPEEPTKKPRAQNRFSTPAFSNNLMMDLGNFLKKSKKPANDDLIENERPMSPEKRTSPPPRITSPRSSKQTTPVHSLRSPLRSPDSAKHDTSASPKSTSPMTDRKKVVVKSSSPRVASPLTLETEAKPKRYSPMEVEPELEIGATEAPGPLAAELGGPFELDVDDVAERPDSVIDNDSVKLLGSGVERIAKTEAEASKSEMKLDGSDKISKSQPPPPRPKPKPTSSSAMLVKAAATSSQNQIAKEEEKKIVVNAKPRWLEELKSKKQKEEVPKKRRVPLIPKEVETGDQETSTNESSGSKALPKWIRAEASKMQKTPDSDVIQDTSRERLSTSGGELSSRFKEKKPEVKREPSWLTELNRRKQSREIKTETSTALDTNVDEQRANVSGFDYRSSTKPEEMRKGNDDNSDEEFVSISNIKKRLSKKSKLIDTPSKVEDNFDRKLSLDRSSRDKIAMTGLVEEQVKEETTEASSGKDVDKFDDKFDNTNSERTLKVENDMQGTRMNIDSVQETEDVEMNTEKELETISPESTSKNSVATEETMQIEDSSSVMSTIGVSNSKRYTSDANMMKKTPEPTSEVTVAPAKTPEPKEKYSKVEPDNKVNMPSDTEKINLSKRVNIGGKGDNSETPSRNVDKNKFGTDNTIDKRSDIQIQKDPFAAKNILTGRKGPVLPKKPPIVKAKPKVFKRNEAKIDGSDSAGSSRTSSPVPKDLTSAVRSDGPLSRSDSPLLRSESPLSRGQSPLSRGDSPVSRSDSPLLRELKGGSQVKREDSPVMPEGSLASSDNNLRQKEKVQSEKLLSSAPNEKTQHAREELPKPLRVKLVRVNSFEQAALSKPKFEPKSKDPQDSSKETISKPSEESSDIPDGKNTEFDESTLGPARKEESQVETEVTSHKAKMMPASPDISETKSNINEGKVDFAVDNIKGKESEIERLDVKSLEAKMNKDTIDIKKVVTSSDAKAHDTETNTQDANILTRNTKVVGQDSKVATLDTKVTTLDTNVAKNDTKVVAHDAKAKTHDTKIMAQDIDIAPKETRVVVQDSKVTSYDTKVTAQDTGVGTEDTKVVAQDSKVMPYDTKVTAQHTDVATDDTKVRAQDTKVMANDSKVIEQSTMPTEKESRVAAPESKLVEGDRKKPLPPRIKPKPKIKPKGFVRPADVTSKDLTVKNEKNSERVLKKETEKQGSLESRNANETKENIVENREIVNKDSTVEVVSMRTDRNKHRRPISMIEDVKPLSQNIQFGMRDRTSSTSSNRRFSTELEKKQNACWFRGVLPTNIENIDEYDDIPLWKKQLLARLKPADKTGKKATTQNSQTVADKNQGSGNSSTKVMPTAPRPQKKDTTNSKDISSSSEKENDDGKLISPKKVASAFSKESDKTGIMKTQTDEEWV